MRWLVGDVQGCAREFDDLLTQIQFDPSRDELWCLGDLVNRGPDSLAALRLWRDVGGHGLIGNHDIYALRAAADPGFRKRDTLQSLFDAPDGPALLELLRNLPVLVRLPGAGGAGDVWIVHAGLDPRWEHLDQTADRLNAGTRDADWLQREEVSFATRVRCCTADGRPCRHSGLPADCPEPSRPWDEFYAGEQLVVHGHWAVRGYYRGPRTMGLDSGCVYGGKLTAWCMEENRLVQIPARRRKRSLRPFSER